MPHRRLVLACLLSVSAVGTLAARQAGTAAADRPRFTSQTAAVQVDVVVRDRKGAPVRGLTADDFEVFEDGVPQRLISCDAVGQAGGSPPPLPIASPAAPATPTPKAAEAAPQAAPTAGQTVVALVFDWLSEQSRAEAWKAARTLLNDMKPGDYAGVFSIDHSLQQIVGFTNNTAALDGGFARALERPRPGDSRPTGAMVNALVARPEISPTAGADQAGVPASSAQATPAGGATAGSGNADAQFAAMLARLDEMDRYTDKEMQANASSDALRGLVRRLGPLSGRKTVVLFSEGLSITNASIDRWHRLQEEANSHNVAFYTFDALGLRVQSQQAEMGRRLGPQFGGGYATGQFGDGTESRLEALLGGTTHGLAELASSTGGQYISDTNNLAGAFARVNEDRPYYYMLVYASSNPALDHSYRSIRVKVRRPGMTVRARPGYVAETSVGLLASREYEAPALAALDVHPQPLAFPFRLQAFSTPMPAQPGAVALIADVDASVLAFTEDTAAARYAGQVTILARVKSKAGDVLFSRSEHYNLSGDAAQLAKARAARILFFTAPDLPPGSHTVEWVVRDDESGRASVARSPLEVPEKSLPIVGDLILVSHSESAARGKRVANNPLAWKGQLLYPRFGEPIRHADNGTLSFALPMVLTGRARDTTASLRLLAGSRVVAELPLDLGQPAKDGRLVALGHLPIGFLPPGSYDLEVTVADGEQRVVRSAGFSVTK